MAGQQYKKELEYLLWKVFAGMLFAVLALACLVAATPVCWTDLMFACWVRESTGLFCPGCGATRALLCLFRCDIAASLWYHPAVLYTACVLGCFFVRGCICIASKGRFPFMKFRTGYIYLGLGIVLLQCALKNIALLVFHVRWMA